MTGKTFKVDVVEREAVECVGLKVRTTMESAASDCPRLWYETFGPRMEEVASFPNVSYGISLMTDETHFDYWAALPYRAGDAVPEGMGLINLPAGQYAECHIASLDDLAEAYQHIFFAWGEAHKEYEFLHTVPSYELYPADHAESGHISLYMPVKLREGT